MPRLPLLPRLRTVAALMLLAGLSLGVFAAKALSTWHLPLAGDGSARVSPIEDRVRFYQRAYDLDESGADLVRRELLRYDRHVMDKVWEFRKQHDAWFTWAREAATKRLEFILEKRMIPSGGYALDPSTEPKITPLPAPGRPGAKGDEPKKDDQPRKNDEPDDRRADPK